MAGERGGADVERHAVQPVAQPRPDRHHLHTRPDRHRHTALAAFECRLQVDQDGVVDVQPGELPLLRQRRAEPLQVTDRVDHRRLVHLDVVQGKHRVDRHLQPTRVLADHLAVHLAGLRHVDHHVVEDPRRTSEPAPIGERPTARVAELRGRRGTEPGGVGLYAGARADLDLASPADPARATHGVEVDPQGSGRLQHGGAGGEGAASAGRGERDVGRPGRRARHRSLHRVRHGLQCRSRSHFWTPAAAAVGTAAASTFLLAVGWPVVGDPGRAVGIVAGEYVGGTHHLAHLRVERVRDCRGQAGADRHGQEAGVDRRAVGQAEADVGGAARRVHPELGLQPLDERHHLSPCCADRPDRHHQRVDHNVRRRDAMVGRPVDDHPRDLEAHVGVLVDAGLVVGDGDDGRAVLRHQRQHRLESICLAGDRVDQRLPVVRRETCLERGDDRGVDGQGYVDHRLHLPNGLRQDGRLVGERDAGVHVENGRARLHLGDGVCADAAEVTVLHLLGEDLAPGRVDPLPDDRERSVVAEHDLARPRADDGLVHGVPPSWC